MTEETETPNPDEQQVPEPQERPEPQEGRESRESLLSDIGRRLREAREERQLSTDEIARELKLRASYLISLENGDWSTLPGDVYSIAFARQYARYLQLDLEEEIARISSDEYQLTKPLTFPDPPIAPAKRWAVTAALLFILLFIAFNVFHSVVHKRQQPSGPVATHPVAPPPAPKPQVAAKPTAPSTPVAAPTSAIAPAAPITAQATPSAPPAAANPAQTSAAATASAPTTASTSTTASSKPAYAHRYRFEADGGDVWLQLYDGPNNLVKEALLRQGQHMDVDTNAASLTMDCGNVGAIAISIDGKSVVTAGQIGPIGKVVRNYPLKAPAP